MLKTLRSRLITVFVLFGLFALSISFLSHWGVKKQQELECIKSEVNQVHVLMLQDSKMVGDFFAYESESDEFLGTEISTCLSRHYEISNQIKNKIEFISQMKSVGKFDVMNTLDSIHNQMYYFDISFNKIIRGLAKRGNYNHGLINRLKVMSDSLLKEDRNGVLIKMKRFESEYLYCGKKQYADSVKNIRFVYRKKISENKREKIDAFIFRYFSVLDDVLILDKEIGLRTNSGLKQKVDIQLSKIESVIDSAMTVTQQKEEELIRGVNSLMVFYVFFVVLVIIGVGVVLAYVFSNDIPKLSYCLDKFVKSDFKEKVEIEIKSKKGEIRTLVNNVSCLQDRVIQDIRELEQCVEERTKEIELQKVEIENQHEEILSQHEVALAQRDFISTKNKLFLDSLNYAKNIQQATLPSDDRVAKVFPDSFVLYKPKETVSGDFYWIRELECCGSKYKFFVVADCTGHGVPGAFMSLLGVSYLNDVLLKTKCPDPGVILDKLRNKVIKTFQGGLSENLSDGMDMTIGIIDEGAKKMFFAGANHNLHIVRNGVMKVVKGDRMPVGDYPVLVNRFKSNIIDIEKGDVVYAFSDGYPDQFSELTERKYYVKRFKETLLQIHQEEMSEQKNLLEKIFLNWKGNMDQTDDVLVVGIRF